MTHATIDEHYDPQAVEATVQTQWREADAFRAIVLAGQGDERQPQLVDNRSLMQTLALVGRNKQLPVVTQLCAEESLNYSD